MNSAFDDQVLQQVVEHLFEDHDSNHILLQSFEVLVKEDVHEVTDVGIHELEDVRLVNHGVFQTAHIPVVFFCHKSH